MSVQVYFKWSLKKSHASYKVIWIYIIIHVVQSQKHNIKSVHNTTCRFFIDKGFSCIFPPKYLFWFWSQEPVSTRVRKIPLEIIITSVITRLWPLQLSIQLIERSQFLVFHIDIRVTDPLLSFILKVWIKRTPSLLFFFWNNKNTI